MTVTQSDIDALLIGAAGGGEAKGSGPASSGQTRAGPAAPAAGDAHPPSVATPPARNQRRRPMSPSLERILRIHVPVHVNIAERTMDVATIMELNVGSILEFNKAADSDLQLVVVNECIGAGRAVKVGENFGLQITTLGSMTDRIHALGG